MLHENFSWLRRVNGIRMLMGSPRVISLLETATSHIPVRPPFTRPSQLALAQGPAFSSYAGNCFKELFALLNRLSLVLNADSAEVELDAIAYSLSA